MVFDINEIQMTTLVNDLIQLRQMALTIAKDTHCLQDDGIAVINGIINSGCE